MISGRTGDNAVSFFFIGKLGYFVISTSYFERTGQLQILRFQIYLTVRIDLRSIYKISMTDNLFQYVRSLINLI